MSAAWILVTETDGPDEKVVLSLFLPSVFAEGFYNVKNRNKAGKYNMYYTMFHGKIHRATITEANLNYVGSITIDQELMKAAGILKGERVQVVDIDNGNRLETYVIPGQAHSGIICLNGAAARLVSVGDKVIIIAYAQMDAQEAKTFIPSVVIVDDKNMITEIHGEERHGQIA